MKTESSANELLSLIEQTQEQLAYFQELGVAGISIEPGRKPDATRQPVSKPHQSLIPPTVQSQPRAKPATETLASTVQRKTESSTLPQDSLFGDLAPHPPSIVKSAETLEQIWEDIGDCTRCPLYQGRTNIVHTEGSRKARLMFVGEAPGADEDAQARPFVGRAGQLLTKIIESLGLKREEVLIGNVNRCRPPGNRPPTPEEATMCKPFLLREIASVAPEAIVVLGNTAMRNLLEVKEGITKLRGQFQDYKGIKIMPTFHPAYLLRDPSKKRETWEDLKKVRDYLDNKPRS